MVLSPDTLVLATEEAQLWDGILFEREPSGWESYNWDPSLASVLPFHHCVVSQLGFPQL